MCKGAYRARGVEKIGHKINRSKKLLHKFLFKIPLRREIDNATSYFSISSKTLSKIIGGKREGGGGIFCGEFRFLFLKLMFTHSASC